MYTIGDRVTVVVHGQRHLGVIRTIENYYTIDANAGPRTFYTIRMDNGNSACVTRHVLKKEQVIICRFRDFRSVSKLHTKMSVFIVGPWPTVGYPKINNAIAHAKLRARTKAQMGTVALNVIGCPHLFDFRPFVQNQTVVVGHSLKSVPSACGLRTFVRTKWHD